MKHLFLLPLVIAFTLQMGLFAQPIQNQPTHQIEVQVQRVPVDQEENNPVQNADVHPQTGRESEERTGPDSTDSTPSHEPVKASQTAQNMERTLAILKPDAVRNRHIGDIIARFENSGLHVVGLKMVKLDKDQAAKFYNIHRDRPFFNDLVNFMSSGPVVVLVLEGKDAINKNRKLIGATDPNKAEKGTIRADFAESVTENSVHGSDSSDAAREEINFFFQPNELYSEY